MSGHAFVALLDNVDSDLSGGAQKIAEGAACGNPFADPAVRRTASNK